MGWKTIRGRKYLYKKVRSRGKEKTVYLGRGPTAELVAMEMQRRKEELAAQRKVMQETKATAMRLQQPAADAADEFQLILRASLLAAGFYQHNRGAWRPRRSKNGT